MKAGTLIAIVITVLGLSAMVVAFITSASPYVTVSEARSTKGDNLHVAGDIVPGTIFTNGSQGQVKFDIRDANGDQMPVIYQGTDLANLGNATKVVAIGGLSDGVFRARQLLIKCPSKYESKPKSSGYSSKT